MSDLHVATANTDVTEHAPIPTTADVSVKSARFEAAVADDYAIAHEDADLAHHFSRFDPLAVPSPVQADASIKIPDTVSLSSLSPAMREPIQAKLQEYRGNDYEGYMQELVEQALVTNSIELRIKAGVGPDATPYERACFEDMRKRHALNTELFKLGEDHAAVERIEVTYDDQGNRTDKIIAKVEGERRKGIETRMVQINRELDALERVEGPRALRKALYETVQAHKARADALADNAEVDNRAASIVREERINQEAELRARRLRGQK